MRTEESTEVRLRREYCLDAAARAAAAAIFLLFACSISVRAEWVKATVSFSCITRTAYWSSILADSRARASTAACRSRRV